MSVSISAQIEPRRPTQCEVCHRESNSCFAVTLALKDDERNFEAKQTGPTLCIHHLISTIHNLQTRIPLQVLAPSRRTRKLSQKQERQIMKDIGGRAQSASGARPGYKSDGRLYDKVRMEAKLTYSNSFKLDKRVLDKVRGECVGNEKPAVVIDFTDKSTGRTKDRWVVIPYSTWEKTVNASNDS